MQQVSGNISILALTLALTLATPAVDATVFELPDATTQVVGEDLHIKTRYEDTLVDIARRYSLGYEEITRANPGVDPWLPGEGTDIVVPGRRILPDVSHEGIVVNLPEHRLYYFPKPKRGAKPVVVTYPVSIGKMDWKTPLGETRVVSKQVKPSWYPPESVRKEHAERGEPLPAVVRPGPDNPLGEFAMRLDIHPGSYLIHGTNNPLAVGMPVTHGCIRMYPEDIATLFPTVPVGMKVRLINEPVKVAYENGELWLEVHPPVDAQGQTVEPVLAEFEEQLNRELGASTTAIHWDYAIETLQAARGIPVTVGLQADLAPEGVPGEASPGSPPADAQAPQTAQGPQTAQTPQTAQAPKATEAPQATQPSPTAADPPTAQAPQTEQVPPTAQALPPAQSSPAAQSSQGVQPANESGTDRRLSSAGRGGP
jgi:L,D-transpeptidase ErfK/SrfK